MSNEYIRLPKYPVAPALAPITEHRHPPAGVRVVAEVIDHDNYSNMDEPVHLILYVNRQGLSIVDAMDYTLNDGTREYFCVQFDVPFEFLAWFPRTLHLYRSPQSPYERIETPPESVAGEMLVLYRTMSIGPEGTPGYGVLNLSRARDYNYKPGIYFRPQDMMLGEAFLFEGGFLKVIEDLRDQWQNGTL